MNNKRFESLLVLFFVFSLICAGIAAFFVLLFYSTKVGLPPSGNHGAWGTLGDYIGGILNPIFTFMTVLYLGLTLLYQIFQLKQTRHEFAESIAALKAQQQTMERQSFEQTYFNALQLNRSVSDRLFRFSDGAINLSPTLPSEDPFFGLLEDLRRMYHNFNVLDPPDRGETERDKVCIVYRYFYAKHEGFLARYFKTVKVLTDIIDQLDKKKIYISTFQAQLTPCEHALIFYHGVSGIPPLLKAQIETYGLLQDLSHNYLLSRTKDHYDMYGQQAFGIWPPYPEH